MCTLCAACFLQNVFHFPFYFSLLSFLHQSFRCACGVKRVGISASSSQRPGSQPQQRETSLATSMSCLMFLRSITLGSHRFAKIPMIFQIRNSVHVLLCVTLPIRTIITNLVLGITLDVSRHVCLAQGSGTESVTQSQERWAPVRRGSVSFCAA